MQSTHIPEASWTCLSVIWLHFYIGRITQICTASQANDSLCDALITQQPSPYIIDGSNSPLTLTCNVDGAYNFYWNYNASGAFVPCTENNNVLNTCTYRPQRKTANLLVRCQALFSNKGPENVFCTPNILLAACDVRITQQPSPYFIDGSNSPLTLTCNVVGANNFYWNYNASGAFLPCTENNNRLNTCTYRPQRNTANQEVRCLAIFSNKGPENVFCTPNILLAACDVRITQQPSPYFIDGSNSTMTLTCNVDGATDFFFHYNVSGLFSDMPCQEIVSSKNMCTYKPTTADFQVRCSARGSSSIVDVFCTPDIQLAACDARITQQPSPFFIIDGSNSTMTLTCNVAGATEFYWNYKVSSGFLPCTENYNTVNTCTYRPQRDTANQEVRCRAAFPTNATDIFCTPNIQCYCNATNTGNRKVFVSQQTAPFVIDGFDSPITLTCHAQNSTASTEYTWKDQTGVLKNCQETTPRSRTCTFPLGVGESQDPVTCSVVTAGATTESASCVPVVKIVTTTTNPTTTTSTTTTVSTQSPSTTQSSSTSFSTILGSAMAAVVALIVVMVAVIWKRRVPVPQRRISQVQRSPEPQVTSTGQTYPQEPDTKLEDSISTIVSTQSEASSTGPEDSNVDTDHS